jgi:hypothetical protein
MKHVDLIVEMALAFAALVALLDPVGGLRQSGKARRSGGRLVIGILVQRRGLPRRKEKSRARA